MYAPACNAQKVWLMVDGIMVVRCSLFGKWLMVDG